MELKQWLDDERGRSAALAEFLKIPASFISKIAAGEKPIPVPHMAAIEAFTGGAVTRRDLRPDDWQKIWPELAAAEPVAQGV